ncbi:sulfite exporter TauE/SafE family protein [Citreimonas sp.]|uniref:sulfite exporter TauE/SafE family protein n=1 Tax=Citreimonas sp. TaxID=3036715 RepID=UPI0035C7F481
MDLPFPDLSPLAVVLALCVALLAGVVKGIVGFAMPMIMISGLSSLMTPEIALAGLILPTLITNGMQALRQGPRAAVGSIGRFRLFLVVGLVALLISSQLVAVLRAEILLLAIGVPVAGFACLQLAGWQPKLGGQTRGLDVGIGAFAGFIGGLSGVWGPPVVAYLTAMNTEKRDQMRIQGVIYGLGAVALTFAHILSGVFDRAGAVFSAALIVPAVLGMWLGGKVQDRIDQRAFKRATLVVLLVAAANLIRRALF